MLIQTSYCHTISLGNRFPHYKNQYWIQIWLQGSPYPCSHKFPFRGSESMLPPSVIYLPTRSVDWLPLLLGMAIHFVALKVVILLIQKGLLFLVTSDQGPIIPLIQRKIQILLPSRNTSSHPPPPFQMSWWRGTSQSKADKVWHSITPYLK